MRRTYLKRFLIAAALLLCLGLPLGQVWGQAAARAGFFEDFTVRPDGRIEVPVEVRDVTDLYAIDIEIQFDPAIVQVEDADPDKPGIQPALGTFLDAGLVLFNEVDNETGQVKFVMTQVNPAEPKSGDGVVLVLYFVGLQEGDASLAVTFVELAMRTGEGIEVEGEDGSLMISAEAEEKEATRIPVQDPTLIIVIPTLAPTETPTPTPEPTETPLPTETESPPAEPTPIEVGAVVVEEDQEVDDPGGVVEEDPAAADESRDEPAMEHGFSIIQYWWAVLLVVLLAIGMAIYLMVTRR